MASKGSPEPACSAAGAFRRHHHDVRNTGNVIDTSFTAPSGAQI